MGLRSILRATAVLSATSIASLVISLLAVKAYSVLLGPEGWGYMGLCLGAVALLRIIASLGIGEGLVRLGARALAEHDDALVAALRRAAWLLCFGLSAVTAALLITFRAPISRLVLGGPEHAGDLVVLSSAVFFAVAAETQGSLLNAYHRVGALARVGVVHVVLGTVVSVVIVWRWGIGGVPVAVLSQAVIEWGVSWCWVRKELKRIARRPGRNETLDACRRLLRFGGPYTISIFLGRGVHLLLPVIVLHELGQASVGHFRAASAISVGYLGFLLDAMKKDYFPRVSGATDRETMTGLIEQQQRLIGLLSTPIIIGTLALAPYLVPVVFSREFSPAVEVLEWQLIGDLFRFSTWTLGYVILARGSELEFFSTQLVGGLALLLCSWLGLGWFGLAGLGMGFLAACIVAQAFVWHVARRHADIRWTTDSSRLVLIALAALFVVAGCPAAGLDGWRTPLALVLACALGLHSLTQIRHALGKQRETTLVG